MNQKWHNKQDLKGVAFYCSSKQLGLDILANDPIKGLWYFTLDERYPDSLYYGPYRSKEQADRVAATYTDHWKKRLWYL